MAQNTGVSIDKFNQINETNEMQNYNIFRNKWIDFLNFTSFENPPKNNPTWGRKVIEGYLESTGGLKRNFAKALEAVQIFSVSFERPSDEFSSSRSGGYHRGTKIAFDDPAIFNPQNVLKTYIHEGAHRLDSELNGSLKVYNDPIFIQNILEKINTNAQLNSQDLTDLNSWLIAGLNRGFLGEYRAWLLTFMLYKEGRQDGTFKEPIDWLEDLMIAQPKNLDDRVYIFRHLSPTWTDPSEGIFSHNLIQAQLAQLRARLYANPLQVQLGKIGEILYSK